MSHMHIALLGDSIFDNAAYVPGESPLAAQLETALPSAAVTLLALDGSSSVDVEQQLKGLPDRTTHVVISVGGNDALNASSVLASPATTVAEAVLRLAEIQTRFQRDYTEMLDLVLRTKTTTVVCTVYDAIPGLGDQERTALSLFNDVILRSAFQFGLPVIDLRFVCDAQSDFSAISVIEPSSRGAGKIAHMIARVAQLHDFAIPRTVVYTRLNS